MKEKDQKCETTVQNALLILRERWHWRSTRS